MRFEAAAKHHLTDRPRLALDSLRFQLAYAVVVLLGILLFGITALVEQRLETEYLREVKHQQESNVNAVSSLL